MTVGDGYTCPACQDFVLWRSQHICSGTGTAKPIYGSGGQTFPYPLTADDVRRIVREELERALKDRP